MLSVVRHEEVLRGVLLRNLEVALRCARRQVGRDDVLDRLSRAGDLIRGLLRVAEKDCLWEAASYNHRFQHLVVAGMQAGRAEDPALSLAIFLRESLGISKGEAFRLILLLAYRDWNGDMTT